MPFSLKHLHAKTNAEIAEDAKHGKELICSFPACRNGGVKFLYCFYCKGAIARRHFRTFHLDRDRCLHSQSRLRESAPSMLVTTPSATKRVELGPSKDKYPTKKRMKLSVVADDDGLRILASAGPSGSTIVATSSRSDGEQNLEKHTAILIRT
jgi:hypothetical protein